MNKKYIVALVVILIIATLGLVFPKGNTVVNQVQQKLGATPTLDGVDNPFVSINGAKLYYYSQPLTASSSVVCSIKNPFNGPAILLSYGVSATGTPLTVGGIGNQVLDLATSTTAYGTSSPAFLKEAPITLTAGQSFATLRWLPQATSTARILGSNGTTGLSDVIIGASEYLNLRISTTTSSGTFSTYYTGKCSGVFQKL